MWFWLALFSALLGAFDVILNKKALHKIDVVVFTWIIFILPIPLLSFLALREGIPAVNLYFFLATFISSLVFICAKIIFNHILKHNFISKILPLSSFNAFFTYIFALVFLHESIKMIPLLGLVFTIFGAYILNVDKAREGLLRPFKLLFLTKESGWFLFAVLLGSLTVTLDKWALNNTSPTSPVFTLLVEQTIMSIILSGYLINKKYQNWLKEVRSNFFIILLNCITFIGVALLVFYAYMGAPVALVLGVKRLQIFFILLLGYLFFKDKPTKHTWIATVIMILGVLMIRLG